MKFKKNCFPATFAGHLEFMHKRQKPSYLGNCRDFEFLYKYEKNTYSSSGDFSQKLFSRHEQILNPVGIGEVTCSASEKC